MRKEDLPGVNFGAKIDASVNGDGVGSITFDAELEDVEGDDDGLPNGRHLRRFVGR
jgi:hypothetical protein